MATKRKTRGVPQSWQLMALCQSSALLLLASGYSSGAPLTTALPDNVAQVPGACTDYQNALAATGAIQPNGTTHPGACQFTDFVTLFHNEEWQRYLADVKAWGIALKNLQYLSGTNPAWPYRIAGKGPPRAIARPYTINGYATARQACVKVVNFDEELSAQIKSSRLEWDHPAWPANSPSACANEWARVDPAITKQGLAMAAANQIVQGARNQLKSAFSQHAFCASDQQGAEEKLAMAVIYRVQQMAALQSGQWQSMRPTFDGPGAGMADTCAIHCELCATGSGWAGHIQCTKTLASAGTDCNQNLPDLVETQDWYVHGPPQAVPTGSDYPATFTATGSWCNGKYRINDTSSVEWALTTTTNDISFGRDTNTSTQVKVNYASSPGAILSSFEEYLFSGISGAVNATELNSGNSWPLIAGDGPTIYAHTGTVNCTWDLIKQ
jgi:hypothetical protein